MWVWPESKCHLSDSKPFQIQTWADPSWWVTATSSIYEPSQDSGVPGCAPMSHLARTKQSIMPEILTGQFPAGTQLTPGLVNEALLLAEKAEITGQGETNMSERPQVTTSLCSHKWESQEMVLEELWSWITSGSAWSIFPAKILDYLCNSQTSWSWRKN